MVAYSILLCLNQFFPLGVRQYRRNTIHGTPTVKKTKNTPIFISLSFYLLILNLHTMQTMQSTILKHRLAFDCHPNPYQMLCFRLLCWHLLTLPFCAAKLQLFYEICKYFCYFSAKYVFFTLSRAFSFNEYAQECVCPCKEH